MSKELTYEDLERLPSGTKVFVIYNITKWRIDPRDLESEYHTLIRVPRKGYFNKVDVIQDRKTLIEYIENEDKETDTIIDLVDSSFVLIGDVKESLKNDLLYVYTKEPNGEDLL